MFTVINPREIWFTTTKTGTRRAWYYSHRAMRALPLSLAQAELEIATGIAVEGTKPGWVGTR